MSKKRKTKYVVWLNNYTDQRDDEWEAVFAHSRKEAQDKVKEKYDRSSRFSVGNCYTIKEFRARYGRNWPV